MVQYGAGTTSEAAKSCPSNAVVLENKINHVHSLSILNSNKHDNDNDNDNDNNKQ